MGKDRKKRKKRKRNRRIRTGYIEVEMKCEIDNKDWIGRNKNRLPLSG